MNEPVGNHMMQSISLDNLHYSLVELFYSQFLFTTEKVPRVLQVIAINTTQINCYEILVFK